MVVDILLALILAVLVYAVVFLTLAWKKVSIYLTWNTRYQTAEYEKAVNTPKIKKPSLPARKLEQNGRQLRQQDDLVDLRELDFETGYKALEDLANGS